jgi:hypothetical protein
MTAAAVTGSVIISHNARVATGASVTEVMVTAFRTPGQKRLFGAALGRSVRGRSVAMVLTRDLR